ncbi:helix-turn-helix transcriptional regulator [Hyunsoonleella ulvae]|uniref:helix-turn-helix transcriptional regulator n=1 Tax=Hyunsoonleella ulvae TaxID=2799948 RepID=UPI00193AC940|nr:hypothetical protein [Hyunsoonleella ulvae]
MVFQWFAAQETSRFVDYIYEAGDNLQTSEKAQAFLDSIPRPLEDYIDTYVDEYYIIQGLIYGYDNNSIKAIQSFNKALSYAEKENDYFNAGYAYIQLFRELYDPSVDNSLALSYLDKAKTCFETCSNICWLYEIELIKAYMKYLDGKTIETINTILPNLGKYKAVLDEDAYIYMDATARLVLSYIKIDSVTKAQSFYKEFKTTRELPTAPTYNYRSFSTVINLEFADYFLREQQLDSCKFYLSEVRPDLIYLDKSYVMRYYNMCVDLNRGIKNYDMSDIYLDSLRNYEDEILQTQLIATTDISRSMRLSEDELKTERTKRKHNVVLVLILLMVLILSSMVYFVFYKKQKKKLHKVSSEVDTLSFVRSNNEQLALKMHGLEEYLKHLKNEIKDIATENSLEDQKTRIKNLYTDIRVNSSAIIDKGEGHFDLVNDLNSRFFSEVSKLHPELNKTEIIICYYVYLEFTNKEISVFLNSSIRSVESRRYRIVKKIGFDREKFTLAEYLCSVFSDKVNIDNYNI